MLWQLEILAYDINNLKGYQVITWTYRILDKIQDVSWTCRFLDKIQDVSRTLPFPELNVTFNYNYSRIVLWIQAQVCNLQTAYLTQPEVKPTMRSILVLSYLPAEKISGAQQVICVYVKDNIDFTRLTDYIYNTWVVGKWKPSDWSCYRRSVRTNNDAEGYHRGIMDKANGKHSLKFYQLVSFLHAECVTVGRQVTW